MKVKKAGRGILLLILAIIIFNLLFFKVTGEKTNIALTPVATVNKATETKPQVPKVLLDIMWCESGGFQSKININYRKRVVVNSDGSTSTIKVFHSRDIGLFQINEKYHLDNAKSLGIDIYTAEGNTKYAIMLYNKNGTRDWDASKPCWSNIEAWKAKQKSFY